MINLNYFFICSENQTINNFLDRRNHLLVDHSPIESEEILQQFEQQRHVFSQQLLLGNGGEAWNFNELFIHPNVQAANSRGSQQADISSILGIRSTNTSWAA
jgi:hypothetical protein